MDMQDARQFLMSLPGVTEEPHHEKSSFRVRGKIFATVPPDEEYIHVLLDEPIAEAVIAANRDAVEELWWGRRLVGVRVALAAADEDLVVTLLEEAYRLRSPQ